jgi:hypothetical protein
MNYQELSNNEIVNIYHDLDNLDKDLMVVMVNLFDFLHTNHSDKKKIIRFIQLELRGYPDAIPATDIPNYRKILINDFEFPQESELLGIQKVIQRLEGRTIILQSLEELRGYCILEPIEENLYVQNKKYGWEKIEVRGEVNNLLGGTDKDKTYPKQINDVILNKIEGGIRENLKHRLKAYFPEIQQQIFDIKLDSMRVEIEFLKGREKDFTKGIRIILWSQRVWVHYLCSQDQDYNWYVCGICLSKRKLHQWSEKIFNAVKWFFANKVRGGATILGSVGLGALTWDELVAMVEEILKILSL